MSVFSHRLLGLKKQGDKYCLVRFSIRDCETYPSPIKIKLNLDVDHIDNGYITTVPLQTNIDYLDDGYIATIPLNINVDMVEGDLYQGNINLKLNIDSVQSDMYLSTIKLKLDIAHEMVEE